MSFLHGTLSPSGCSKQVTFCYLLLNITAERSMWCKVVATKEEETPLVLLTAEGCQTHTCGRAGIAVRAPEKLASANAMTQGNSSREQSRISSHRAAFQLGSNRPLTQASTRQAQIFTVGRGLLRIPVNEENWTVSSVIAALSPCPWPPGSTKPSWPLFAYTANRSGTAVTLPTDTTVTL